MKNLIYLLLALLVMFSSCTTTNTVLKSNDRDYKFEVAKQLYAQGKYSGASLLLDNILPGMKNTKAGDEALFLMGMCKFNTHDYDAASELFKRYYTRSYPNGMYVDDARFYAAKSFYESTNAVKLDQTNTYVAIKELQNLISYNPDSKFAEEIRQLLFNLQDRLVEKEYMAAMLYYNLGEYFLNCTMGGSNYQACVVTAQNAITDYPYSPRKEDFAILILKAKYQLARSSIESKKIERLNDTIDEYYGFINEFPQSRFSKQAKDIFDKSDRELKRKSHSSNAQESNNS